MPQSRVRHLSILTGLLFLCAAGNASGATTFVSLYSFCPDGGQCVDGAFPVAGLTADAHGNLFGVTSSGGTNGTGEIFELARSGSTYTFQPLHSLASNEGQDLVTPLIVDTHGNLYGTTEAGGAHSGGTVFKLSHDKTRTEWTFHDLYDFCSQGGSTCTDGETPLSQLTSAGASDGVLYDGTSTLYGTAESGGTNDGGTVFALTGSGSPRTEQVIYNFCAVGSCQDGEAPEGNLAIDSKGRLYGTARGGGINSGGVLYRVTPSTSTEKVLHRFCSKSQCVDGSEPSSGVSFAAPDVLLGTTRGGGANGKGEVFSYLLGSGLNVVYSFCQQPSCTDGFTPTGPATVFNTDTAIGTIQGGNSFGTGIVYQAISKRKAKQLHVFCLQFGCIDGTNPQGGLVAFNNHLFGTTQSGGKFSSGTVYEITP